MEDLEVSIPVTVPYSLLPWWSRLSVQQKEFLRKSTTSPLNRSCPAVGESKSHSLVCSSHSLQSSKRLPELLALSGDGSEKVKHSWSTENLSCLECQTATPSKDRQRGEPCSGSGGLLESSFLVTRRDMALSSLGLGDALGRQTCAEVTVWAQDHLCRTSLGEPPVSRLQTPLFFPFCPNKQSLFLTTVIGWFTALEVAWKEGQWPYFTCERVQLEKTSFSSWTPLHKGNKHFWHLHSSQLLSFCGQQAAGTDVGWIPQEKWIPQGIPGQEKSKDLEDSVFHRHHGRRGVEGGAPPSETCQNVKDLTGWWHGHEATVLLGQSHMVVTYFTSTTSKKKSLDQG